MTFTNDEKGCLVCDLGSGADQHHLCVDTCEDIEAFGCRFDSHHQHQHDHKSIYIEI